MTSCGLRLIDRINEPLRIAESAGVACLDVVAGGPQGADNSGIAVISRAGGLCGVLHELEQALVVFPIECNEMPDRWVGIRNLPLIELRLVHRLIEIRLVPRVSLFPIDCGGRGLLLHAASGADHQHDRGQSGRHSLVHR